MSIACMYCKTDNLQSAKYCEECGHKLPNNFCTNSDCTNFYEPINKTARYCNRCGALSFVESMQEEVETGKLFVLAVEFMLEEETISTSKLQELLKWDYGKAYKIMDMMEEHGMLGTVRGTSYKKTLISRYEWRNCQRDEWQNKINEMDDYLLQILENQKINKQK